MTNETTKKVPTHRIYSVTKNGEDQARWVQLGIAFAHRDGKGFDLIYNACPLGDAKVVLRKIEPKQASSGSKRQASPMATAAEGAAA